MPLDLGVKIYSLRRWKGVERPLGDLGAVKLTITANFDLPLSNINRAYQLPRNAT